MELWLILPGAQPAPAFARPDPARSADPATIPPELAGQLTGRGARGYRSSHRAVTDRPAAGPVHRQRQANELMTVACGRRGDDHSAVNTTEPRRRCIRVSHAPYLHSQAAGAARQMENAMTLKTQRILPTAAAVAALAFAAVRRPRPLAQIRSRP